MLRGDAKRAIAAKNRDEVAELARLTAVYAQRGQGRQADADRAAVELQKRDIELAQAEADTLTASARLSELLNLDPSTRFRPIDGWAVPTPVVPDPIPLQELLGIALMQRPELAARRSEIQTSLYELSLAKVLPFSPNVILGLSAGGFGGGSNLVSSPQGFVAGNGQVQTGPRFGNFDGRSDFDVVVFWTFRNLGVGNVALIRAADSRVKQIRLRELETINVVRREVAQAKARVDARFLQIASGEKAVKISTNAYTEDLTRIKGGQGLPLEVIDSFRLLAQSRYQYLDAIIEYNRAQFQLWVAMGSPARGLVGPTGSPGVGSPARYRSSAWPAAVPGAANPPVASAGQALTAHEAPTTTEEGEWQVGRDGRKPPDGALPASRAERWRHSAPAAGRKTRQPKRRCRMHVRRPCTLVYRRLLRHLHRRPQLNGLPSKMALGLSGPRTSQRRRPAFNRCEQRRQESKSGSGKFGPPQLAPHLWLRPDSGCRNDRPHGCIATGLSR